MSWRTLLGLVRWWFGLTYLLCGLGGLLAAPIVIAFGNFGGVYMMIGGSIIAALGWLVHPWGLQRHSSREPVR